MKEHSKKDNSIKSNNGQKGQMNDPEKKLEFSKEILSEILDSLEESGEFYENAELWLVDVRLFSNWLNNQNTGSKAASELENLLLHSALLPTEEDIYNICKLLFTNLQLLQCYYNFYNNNDRGFLDMLIWQQYIPYPEAMQYFGDKMILDKPDIKGDPIISPAFAKWGSFLTLNYFDDNPYDEAEFPSERFDLDYEKFSDPFGFQGFEDEDDYDGEQGDWYGNEEEEVEEGDLNSHPEIYIFVLPEFMQIAFRQIAVKPKDYYLEPIEINQRFKVFESEATIFKELPVILAYLQQGKIKRNKNGYLSIASLRIAAEKLKLHNFPNDSGYVKILQIASNLEMERYRPMTPVLEILQQIFHQQQPGKAALAATLFPIENLKNFYVTCLNPGEITKALSLLRILPKGKWILLHQFNRYLELHEKEWKFEPIVNNYAIEELRLDKHNPDFDAFERAEIDTRKKIVEQLFIRGVLLTAASFGLLDLAYDTHDHKLLYGFYKYETSPWISFTAFRLTPLGARLFKNENDYDTEKSIKDTVGFTLDDAALKIKVIGDMEIARELLHQWTKRSISRDDILELDLAAIVAGCKSKTALIQNIREFKDAIYQELPVNWKAALAQLVNKTNNVQEIMQPIVYKLSPHDLALHKIIAQDKELKKLCFKGENFTLIVSKPHQAAFIRRLSELGYVPSIGVSEDINAIQFITENQTQTDLAQNFDDLMRTASNSRTTKR